MLVNSQQVRLLPVGIFKHVMFHLMNYCFSIPEKPIRGVDNKLFNIIYYLKYEAVFNTSSKPFPLSE